MVFDSIMRLDKMKYKLKRQWSTSYFSTMASMLNRYEIAQMGKKRETYVLLSRFFFENLERMA